MANPLIPKKQNNSKFVDLPHSAGILDDFAVRKNVATKEGTIEKVPVNASDIVNKAYCDAHGGTTDHAALSHLAYADAGHTGFAPALGADDNYVTDAEKIVIGNTSGTNTGDASGHAGLQPIDTTLTTLAALADGAGVLTNNGAGVLSWGAGGGGAHIIKDEGGAGLTARTNLNFTGAGVTATDNAGTDSTDVTIPAWEPIGTSAAHALLTTGIHGVGAGTIAKTADITKAAVGLSNVTDDAQITKALLTEKGDIIYASAASTPAALAHGNANDVLISGGHGVNPSWAAPSTVGTAGIRWIGTVGGQTVGNDTAASGLHIFSASATNIVKYTVYIDADMAGGDLRFTIYWHPSSTNALICYWYIGVTDVTGLGDNMGGAGLDYNSGVTMKDNGGGATDALQTTPTWTENAGTYTAGQFINVWVTRIGDDVGDTFTGTALFDGLLIEKV